MVQYKVSANLMSLGALDFGIIVDGAVVIVENCVRRLAHAQAHYGRPLTRAERFHEVFLASKESRRPLLFGQLIIMVVYLPIFALTGVEGKMFHPMALTVVIALLGAMLLSITFIPAAIALFMGDKVAEKENRLMEWARRAYAPVLDKVMHAPAVVLTAASVIVALSLLLATRMGSEFAGVIVDECHRITQTIQRIIDDMRQGAPNLRVCGLSATPFRLGDGFIFGVDPDGKALPEYVDDLRVKPWFPRLSTIILPWDGDHHEKAVNTTPADMMRKAFPSVAVLAKSNKVFRIPGARQSDYTQITDIQKVRMQLYNTIVHKTNCDWLLECLENYKYEFNTKLQTWSDKPLHDKHSHMMDALRYVVQATNELDFFQGAFFDTGITPAPTSYAEDWSSVWKK